MPPIQKTLSKHCLSGNMNLTELIRLHNHLEELTMQDLQYESSNRFELIIDRVDVPQAGVNSEFPSNTLR